VLRRVDPAVWRFGVFLIVVALGVGFALFRYRSHLSLNPAQLGETIRSWGYLGPIIFITVFILRPFFFFPSSLLILAGGIAFGAGWGTVYAAVGATLGGVVGFGIARILGRDFVQSRFGDALPGWGTTNWGGGLVLVLYLIPVVPITAVNYGAGLSRMALLPFTLAVVGGITPRAFAYSFFGQSLRHVGSGEFILALVLLSTLLVLPLYLRRRVNRHTARPPTPPNG